MIEYRTASGNAYTIESHYFGMYGIDEYEYFSRAVRHDVGWSCLEIDRLHVTDCRGLYTISRDILSEHVGR